MSDYDAMELPSGKLGSVKTTEELQKENNELRAHCERLKAMTGVVFGLLVGCKEKSGDATKDVIDKVLAAFQETPQQSVHEIKAQAIREAVKNVKNFPDGITDQDFQDVSALVCGDKDKDALLFFLRLTVQATIDEILEYASEIENESGR